MMYVWLLVGFILLIKGADFFVEGSSSIAKLLRVPSVVIGLTIVALGTSAPEASVSITSGLTGNNDIALSNVIGSNMFNILVVLGVCAIIKTVAADKEIITRDIPVTIGATVLLFVFLLDRKINRVEGIILLVGIAAYLVVVVRSAMKNREEASEEIEVLSPIKSIVYILGGIIAIIYGGDLVVESASDIAEAFGMSQTLIGLTIVAIGTSLPELVTSVVAASKGESGMALGNAIGSCIFNILFIIGISASLSPMGVSFINIIDITVLIGISVLIGICSYTGKKITRIEGIIGILLYISYMIYAIIR